MAKKFDFVRKITTFLFSSSLFLSVSALAGLQAEPQAESCKKLAPGEKQCCRLYNRAIKKPKSRAAKLLRQFPQCSAWAQKLDAGEQGSQAQAGQNSNPVNTAPMIAGNAGAMALLRNDGTVLAWGNPDFGGDLSLAGIVPSTGQLGLRPTGPSFASQLTNVKALYASREAFAALKHDGTVFAWGSGDAGDNSRVNGLTNVREIVSNDFAFAAIRNDGTVFAWGANSHGGDTSPVASQLTGVISVTPSTNAFVALRNATNNNTVVVWGTGAVVDETAISGLNNVREIFTNGHAFAALQNGGTVFAWGDSTLGGGNVSVANVRTVVATTGAFAAVRNDNTVTAWGSAFHGGTAPAGLAGVTAIAATDYSFAARISDGTVVAWGAPFAGGDTSSVTLTGVEAIYANDFAFAALRNDDTVVTWGSAFHGGDSSSLTLENVKSIATTNEGFAALTFDKEVMSWGSIGTGGSTPFELEGMEALFSTDYSFAALTSEDSVVSWGNALLNHEIEDPFAPFQTVTAPVYAGILSAGNNTATVATAPTTDATSPTLAYSAQGLRPLYSGQGTLVSYHQMGDICTVNAATGEVTLGSAATAGDVCEVTVTFEAEGYQDATATLRLNVQVAISFSQLKARIFDRPEYGCTTCHGASGYNGMQFLMSQATMNAWEGLLHESDPSQSSLYNRLLGIGGTLMPPSFHSGRSDVSAADREYVAAYIRGGGRS